LQARQEEKFEAAPGKEGSGEAGGVVGGVPGAVGMLKDESGRVADEAAPLEAGAAANRAVAKSAVAPRMIAYWVTMTVEVKEFAPAKEKLLKAVEEAGGYVAQASAAETPNQPQRADLTVRVPVEKLPAVLEQVRGLGRVVNEQLSSEEVTAQVVDLEARLRNSRATEARLISVLEQRTGKVADILQVEREIARTREEIERMEAQRKNLVARVELATVSVTLVEEFQAELAPAPVGTATRLRNAFVEGYDNLVGLLLGFVFFFARNGLVLAFFSCCSGRVGAWCAGRSGGWLAAAANAVLCALCGEKADPSPPGESRARDDKRLWWGRHSCLPIPRLWPRRVRNRKRWGIIELDDRAGGQPENSLPRAPARLLRRRSARH